MRNQTWNDRLNLIVNLVVLGVLLFVLFRPGGFAYEQIAAWRKQAEQREAIGRQWDKLVMEGARLDDRGGEVGLIVFADYQCPYCRRSHDELQRLVAQLDVGVVYRHLPLTSIHPAAEGAALAAICAERLGEFDAIHERLFTTSRWQKERDWLALAERSGINEAQAFLSCLKSESAAKRLARDRALAESLGIRGTPAFVGRDGTHMGVADQAHLVEIIR